MNVKIALAFVLYLVVVNLVAFIAFRKDKRLAKQGHKHHRVPESRLLVYAGIGGAFGALVAMRKYHHKTKKRIFRILIPAFLALYMVALFVVLVSVGGSVPTLPNHSDQIYDSFNEVYTDLW